MASLLTAAGDGLAWLIAFVFSAGGMVVGLLVGAVWLCLRPQSRWARGGLLCIAVFYTLASVYAVPYAVSRPLVHGYRAFSASDVPAGRIAIVVLGYGWPAVHDWDGLSFPVLDPVSMSRIAEALRVYRVTPDAWVISSGGGVPTARDPPPAVVMRDVLVRHGVPKSRILLETQSQTTHDEAVLIAPMLRALTIDRVILVTSDTHMRRSMSTFRAEGIIAIPAIATDPDLPRTWRGWIVPSNQSLRFSRSFVHELVGIAAYWVRFGG